MTKPSYGDHIPFRALVPFIAMTFGIAWGIIGLYILLPDLMSATFGSLNGSHPLFFLAVYAPAISAFILILKKEGVLGLKKFLTRALLWRAKISWYLFLILGVPVIFIVGSLLGGDTFADSFPFQTSSAVIIGIFLAAIKGPVEEFGWRGFALPLLQRKLAPFWSGLLLGVVWATWHLPAFLLSGTQQSQWSFTVFFLGCLAISIIATGLFNDSGGSILLSAFFHFTLMNPIFPDAQPYDTYILIVVAALMVFRSSDSMFSKEDSIVGVIPSSKANKPIEVTACRRASS